MIIRPKKSITLGLCTAVVACISHSFVFAKNHQLNTSLTQDTKSVSNIESALQEALNTNPEVLFQKAERESTRHRIDQAVGNYLPTLSIRAGVGREYTNQKFNSNPSTPVPLGSKRGFLSNDTNISDTRTRSDPSIRLTQRLFDGTETINDIRKAKNEFDQSTKNLSEAQALVAFQVIETYVLVRRFERLYRLAQENILVHQSILSKLTKLVSAGKASSSDEESVRSRLFDAEAARDDIEGDLMTAYADFKEVVGVEARELGIPSLSESELPKTLQEAIDIARKNNKSVLVAQASERVSKSEFDKTVSPFMPRLDLEVEARKSFNVAGKDGHETSVVGQVVGTFNVFNGGKDIGRRREFRAKMASAKFRTHREIRRAEKETRISYAEMVSARKQSVALNKAVAAKQRVRDGYMKQFEAGTQSFVGILDASHEYFLAKGSLITADATGDLAVARLYASMGALLDQFKFLRIMTDMQGLGKDGYDEPGTRGTTIYAESDKNQQAGDTVNVATNTRNVDKDLDRNDTKFMADMNSRGQSEIAKTAYTARSETTRTAQNNPSSDSDRSGTQAAGI